MFGPCELEFEPEDINNSLRLFNSNPTMLDASQDTRYTDTMKFIKDGTNPSSMTDDREHTTTERYWIRYASKHIKEKKQWVLDESRLMVPTHARRCILDLLHASHTGIAKMHSQAVILLAEHEERYRRFSQLLHHLPGTAKQQCASHNRSANSAKLCRAAYATSRLQPVLLVNRYSGFGWTKQPQKLDTKAHLEGWFNDFGWPTHIHSELQMQITRETTPW